MSYSVYQKTLQRQTVITDRQCDLSNLSGYYKNPLTGFGSIVLTNETKDFLFTYRNFTIHYFASTHTLVYESGPLVNDNDWRGIISPYSGPEYYSPYAVLVVHVVPASVSEIALLVGDTITLGYDYEAPGIQPIHAFTLTFSEALINKCSEIRS